MHGQQNVILRCTVSKTSKHMKFSRLLITKFVTSYGFACGVSFLLAHHINVHVRLPKTVEQLVSQVKVSEI